MTAGTLRTMGNVEATEPVADLDLLRRPPRVPESTRANSPRRAHRRGARGVLEQGLRGRDGRRHRRARRRHDRRAVRALRRQARPAPRNGRPDARPRRSSTRSSSMVALPWSEASRIMSHGLATPPDRGTLLLLDVIVVARRDPHVAHILRRGLETYLDGDEGRERQGRRARCHRPGAAAPTSSRVSSHCSRSGGWCSPRSTSRRRRTKRSAASPICCCSRRTSTATRTSPPHSRACAPGRRRRNGRSARCTTASWRRSRPATASGRSGRRPGLSHERVRQVLRERAAES